MAIAFGALEVELYSATDAHTYTTGTFTPNVGELLIAVVGWERNPIAAMPTLTGGGLTWSTIQDVIVYSTIASPNMALGWFYAAATAASPFAVTVTFASEVQQGIEVQVFTLTGANTTAPRVQGKTNLTNTAATLNIVLDAAIASDSATICAGGTPVNNAMTPRTLWTEIADNGHTTPAARLESQYRLAPSETTATIDPPGTTAIGGFIAEIAAAGGVVQTLTVSGALPLGGEVSRESTHGVAGALPSSGALARQLSRAFAGASPSSGTLWRQPAKRPIGVLTTAGALGPVQVVRHAAGVLAGSGALLLQRQQTIGLTGVLGLIGAVWREIGIWPGPGLVPIKPFASTVGLTGAVRSQATWVPAGLLAVAGTLRQTVTLRVTHALALTGIAAMIRSQLVPVTGTLPLAGTLAWQGSITTTGIVASTGTLRKTISRGFVATLHSLGALMIGLARPFTGMLPSSSTVDLTQGQAVALDGALGSAGQMRAQPVLDLPSSLGVASVLHFKPILEYQGSLGSEGEVHFGADLQITGQLGLDGALEQTGDRTLELGGTVPMAGTSFLARVLGMSGSIFGAHALAVIVIPSKVLRSILQLEGTVVTSFAKATAGVLPMTGTLRRTITRQVTGVLHPVGAAYQQARVSLAGSISLAGEVTFLGVEILAMAGLIPLSGLLAAPIMERLFVGTLGAIGAVVFTPAILIRYGTITLVNAILRFAGLRSPKLTDRGTVKDPALRDHATLDDSELR